MFYSFIYLLILSILLTLVSILKTERCISRIHPPTPSVWVVRLEATKEVHYQQIQQRQIVMAMFDSELHCSWMSVSDQLQTSAIHTKTDLTDYTMNKMGS